MKEYWEKTKQFLVDEIKNNETSIKGYQDSIANLQKDNETLKGLLEDTKKLE